MFVRADLSNLCETLDPIRGDRSSFLPQSRRARYTSTEIYENLTKNMEPMYNHLNPSTYRTLTQHGVCKKKARVSSGDPNRNQSGISWEEFSDEELESTLIH